MLRFPQIHTGRSAVFWPESGRALRKFGLKHPEKHRKLCTDSGQKTQDFHLKSPAVYMDKKHLRGDHNPISHIVDVIWDCGHFSRKPFLSMYTAGDFKWKSWVFCPESVQSFLCFSGCFSPNFLKARPDSGQKTRPGDLCESGEISA